LTLAQAKVAAPRFLSAVLAGAKTDEAVDTLAVIVDPHRSRGASDPVVSRAGISDDDP
jgi:hypothetical protein